jgi:hypothetical protein
MARQLELVLRAQDKEPNLIIKQEMDWISRVPRIEQGTLPEESKLGYLTDRRRYGLLGPVAGGGEAQRNARSQGANCKQVTKKNEKRTAEGKDE